MKTVLYILLVILTYYLAGMYHDQPLMILGIAELLLMAALFVLPRYLRGRLRVSFVRKTGAASRGTDVSCLIRITDYGRIPAIRLGLRLQASYPQDSAGETAASSRTGSFSRIGNRQSPSALPKKSRPQWLYGACRRGTEELTFLLTARHCGLVRLRLDRLRIYDPLSLFSVYKNLEEQMEIAVFPQLRPLSIQLLAGGGNASHYAQEQPAPLSGDDHQEIRQVREYRTGDSNRYIHWNLSARADEFWIKEFQQETDLRFHILLDTAGCPSSNAARMGAFYELLSAVTLGLAAQPGTVLVHWYDAAAGRFTAHSVADEEQCRDMLLALYHTEMPPEGACPPDRLLEQKQRLQRYFLLDPDLHWYDGSDLIHTFSPEDLEQELVESVFSLA